MFYELSPDSSLIFMLRPLDRISFEIELALDISIVSTNLEAGDSTISSFKASLKPLSYFIKFGLFYSF